MAGWYLEISIQVLMLHYRISRIYQLLHMSRVDIYAGFEYKPGTFQIPGLILKYQSYMFVHVLIELINCAFFFLAFCW